ncbi:MAG: glxK [Firmicutes bacterium]|nr:glxK [Bacillota bacterium]
MHIIVAPDSYKGSLSALAVTEAMERGILAVFPGATVTKLPIADGGEGTVEALVVATGGRVVKKTVIGPMGDHVESFFGLSGDKRTAFIEMAAASGITLVPKHDRDPRRSTTYGTGELILAALEENVQNLIIGIGGSATNDGGVGMAQALGAKFLKADGREIGQGGAALSELDSIDLSKLDARLKKVNIMVACDVDNPLCGSKGASAVYGPQKGATPEMVAQLDQALQRYADIAKFATGKDVANCPGAGAAGGLGAGLLFFTQAQLRPGVEIVLEAIDFAQQVKGAELVITGEGNTDFQTAYGKAPVGVAKVAKQFNIPVVCLSGGLGKGAEDTLAQGIDGLMSILPRPMELEQCITNAPDLVEAAASRVCRLISIGLKMTDTKKIL